MCYGRCVKYIGYKLLILAVLCIVANVLLYFPNGETIYASHNHLSNYVGCGILGGGLLLLASVIVACVGIFGAGYCFIISALALAEGPYCYCEDDRVWCYPFSHSAGGYLLHHPNWTACQEPRNIFTWNVTLFSILLVLSGIELILCIIQVIHGCIGGACAVCHGHREDCPC